MVVRDALAMLVYSTAQNGMCQWVSGAGNFVTAEDKIMRQLGCYNRV